MMTVETRTVDRIAVVSIDVGDGRNEIDAETASELDRVWRRFETDPDLDVAVVTGTREAFSVGRPTATDDETGTAEPVFGFTHSGLSKPVIAAIEGPCLSAGLEMALWCDLRVCGLSSVFGFQPQRSRRPLMDGGTQRLPRLVGEGMALEMLLTGRPMDAEEAHAVGLVNLVVADGSARQAAIEIAERIARFPQGTVRANRQSVLEGADLSLSEGLQLERRLATNAIETRAREIRRASRESGWVSAPFRFELPRSGSGPAVIVLPDRWGMDDYAIAATESLLDAGYVVVPVALYDRPGSEDEASAAPAKLRSRDVSARLTQAVEATRKHPAVDGSVALVGFGIGGGLALWLAGESPSITGCVTFGAVNAWPDLEPDLASAKAAFLGHNGELDEQASPHTAYRLEMAMRELGLDATFETYRAMGWEFYRNGDPEAVHALDQAWGRTMTFLQRTL